MAITKTVYDVGPSNQHTWNMQRQYSRNLQSLQFSLRSQEKCHLIENQTFYLPSVPNTHGNRSWFFCTTIQMTDSVKTKKCCKMVRWLLSLASKKLNRLPLAGRLKFNTRCILYLPPNHTSQLTVKVLTSATKQKLALSIKMAYWIVHFLPGCGWWYIFFINFAAPRQLHCQTEIFQSEKIAEMSTDIWHNTSCKWWALQNQTQTDNTLHQRSCTVFLRVSERGSRSWNKWGGDTFKLDADGGLDIFTKYLPSDLPLVELGWTWTWTLFSWREVSLLYALFDLLLGFLCLNHFCFKDLSTSLIVISLVLDKSLSSFAFGGPSGERLDCDLGEHPTPLLSFTLLTSIVDFCKGLWTLGVATIWESATLCSDPQAMHCSVSSNLKAFEAHALHKYFPVDRFWVKGIWHHFAHSWDSSKSAEMLHVQMSLVLSLKTGFKTRT